MVPTWFLSFVLASAPPTQGPGNLGVLKSNLETLPAKPMFGGSNVPLVVGNQFLQKETS